MVSEEERYKVLEEHINDIGVETFFQSMVLPKGKELTIQGSDGQGMYAKGEGILYVAFIPMEAFEEGENRIKP